MEIKGLKVEINDLILKSVMISFETPNNIKKGITTIGLVSFL
jgi:hypothetical protein